MPDWHFLVVRHVGNNAQRRQICAGIKRHVERQGLANVLPLVKFELNRQREYYLGIALDPNAFVDGCCTEELARSVLNAAGIRISDNPQLCPMLPAEQVKTLLRGNIECSSFTVPLIYEQLNLNESSADDGGQLDLTDEDIFNAQPYETETDKYDNLLYWCSALGSGSIGRIKQTCQLLGISIEWGGAWSVIRRMVLLGHMEFDRTGAIRWSMIRPTLVTSACNRNQYFLAGQRTLQIIEYFKQSAKIQETPQAHGPTRLIIQSPPEDIEYRQGCPMIVAGNVSQKLMRNLPDLDEWIKLLPTWEERDLGRFESELYDLSKNEFREIPSIEKHFKRGLYRFTLEQNSRTFKTDVFYDESNDRWVCGDFYGLRYLARIHANMCQAFYNEDSFQLIIPDTDRWPLPYERALVLAAGLLPHRVRIESGIILLRYEGIPPEMAGTMFHLLRIKPEEKTCMM